MSRRVRRARVARLSMSARTVPVSRASPPPPPVQVICAKPQRIVARINRHSHYVRAVRAWCGRSSTVTNRYVLHARPGVPIRPWTAVEPLYGQCGRFAKGLEEPIRPGCGRFADKTFRRQTLRRQCRTFRRHIQLHKDRIPRHRRSHDVGEDVGVVECGLYAIVCVGETSVLHLADHVAHGS